MKGIAWSPWFLVLITVALILSIVAVVSPGPTGSMGPQGFPGTVGVQGLPGPPGVSGTLGVDGKQGLQGVPGPVGPQGIQGVQGSVGPQGERGERGRTSSYESDDTGELDRTVSRSSDDVFRMKSTDDWSRTEVEGVVGSNGPDENQYGTGFRFTNITVPQGAEITTAYITVRARHNANGTLVKSEISAEDVNSASTFAADFEDFDERWEDRTKAQVRWDNMPSWTADTDYRSPEIKKVIQEIVNRSGWDYGNDIVIFWDDFEDRTENVRNKYRNFWSYDKSEDYCARLHIEYDY